MRLVYNLINDIWSPFNVKIGNAMLTNKGMVVSQQLKRRFISNYESYKSFPGAETSRSTRNFIIKYVKSLCQLDPISSSRGCFKPTQRMQRLFIQVVSRTIIPLTLYDG